MAKGVSISVASDTKDFLKGIKSGVIEPLEDASDTLQDLAKDGKRAGGDIEDAMRDAQGETERLGKDGKKAGSNLEDAMHDAQSETEKLAKEYEDLGEKIRDSSKRGGQGLKDNTADATSAATRDLGELKDEAIQNASETFSSFDGSVDSFVDGLQGTFGGIVSSMGPVGMGIGAALALGIGAAVAKGEEMAEAINEAKERAAELAAELIDAGGNVDAIDLAGKIKEWGLAIEDEKQWFEFWQDDAVTALEAASEAADKFGISAQDLSMGLSGMDADKATTSIKALTTQIKELEDARRRSSSQQERESINGEIRARDELITKLEKQGGVLEEATEQEKLYNETLANSVAEKEAATAAMEARADAADALQSALDDGVAAWSEYADAETGALDPAAYIAGMQARMDATSNFNSNVQLLSEQFGLTTEEVQALLDQGVDFAPMLQSIIDSGLAPEFIAQMQAAVGGGQELLDGTPLNATVGATADVKRAKGDLEETSKDRDTTVKADADVRRARADLDSVASKRRTATITARPVTGAASNALAQLARPRVAPVRADASTYGAESQLAQLTRTRYMTIVADVQDRRGRSIR